MTSATADGIFWMDALEASYPGFNVGYVECNKGWESVIRRFLDTVVENVASVDDFKTVQIKEKYGALVIHYSLSDDVPDENREKIEAACDAAEEESRSLCEITGNPGQLIRRGGYVMVRCEELTQEGDVVLERTVRH